jgi:hypothetical protein
MPTPVRKHNRSIDKIAQSDTENDKDKPDDLFKYSPVFSNKQRFKQKRNKE